LNPFIAEGDYGGISNLNYSSFGMVTLTWVGEIV